MEDGNIRHQRRVNLIYKKFIVMLNEVDNSFKVDIDNKKDEHKTIQLFF